MNSWNAEPGELPYDDRDDGPRANAQCEGCRRPFRMDHANDTGSLCDRCVRQRDAVRDEQRRTYARRFVEGATA